MPRKKTTDDTPAPKTADDTPAPKTAEKTPPPSGFGVIRKGDRPRPDNTVPTPPKPQPDTPEN